MKTIRSLLAVVILAVLTAGISACSTPAPRHVAELRDYPGQSYYCYLHKQDAGC